MWSQQEQDKRAAAENQRQTDDPIQELVHGRLSRFIGYQLQRVVERRVQESAERRRYLRRGAAGRVVADVDARALCVVEHQVELHGGVAAAFLDSARTPSRHVSMAEDQLDPCNLVQRKYLLRPPVAIGRHVGSAIERQRPG